LNPRPLDHDRGNPYAINPPSIMQIVTRIEGNSEAYFPKVRDIAQVLKARGQ